jgi:hypothetical protein
VLGSIQGGQINALARVQKKAAKFADLTNESNWKTLAQRRNVVFICGVYKAYSREPAWKAILFYKSLFVRELNTYTAEPESTKIAPV